MKPLILLASVQSMLCGSSQAADLPVLPSGPEGPGPFGAVYARLEYSPAWDTPWRVGDHPDVVVRFDDGGHRFVFWRGTSYIPCWVTDKGVWYTNEFVERRGRDSPNTEGCVEPMSDKQCRFSHVRIIESSDARVVVHWRYAPVDVHYEHPFIEPETGWGDWVDEYYTIYPNAVGVRLLTLHTTQPDAWTEFHESIVLNQPGTMPEDNIELGALSVCNMKGEGRTYVWNENGAPEFDGPEDCHIVRVNLKGTLKPFAFIAPPGKRGRVITPYKGHAEGSCFNWWDHWPVSQDANDTRVTQSKANPSHTSLCHIAHGTRGPWKPIARTSDSVTKVMVHGMTDKPVEGLIPLARSWVSPPEMKVSGGHYVCEGYDETQMAFVLASTKPGRPESLSMEIAASKGAPLVDPVFAVKGWGQRGAQVSVNGERATDNAAVRIGHRRALDSTDLIVWLKLDAAKPTTILLEPEVP